MDEDANIYSAPNLDTIADAHTAAHTYRFSYAFANFHFNSYVYSNC